MKDLHDLELILKQQTPIVTIASYEEPRILELVVRLAGKIRHKLYRWSVTDGLVNGAIVNQRLEPKHSDPQELLEHIRRQTEQCLYILCDFHPYFDNPTIIRLLKDIALYQHGNTTLLLVSHELTLPKALHRYSANVELSFPDPEEIHSIIVEEARRWQKLTGASVTTDQTTLNALKQNLQGLTHSDVRHLVRGAIVHDGAITQTDIPQVNKAKFDLMNMKGILHYEYDTAKFSDVGGLDQLKSWLDHRRSALLGTDKSMDIPKGVMLFGVQGGGKSLAAKAIAGIYNLPLLRLDIGALYNKFYGETERNLRDTLSLADNVAPCVLWLDEMEKALAQGDNEGISQRLLATLLTWMAERKSRVFVVATSNDITRLPPELIRKGRLDEIFFVDLPPAKVRKTIVDIHLKKRELQLPPTDIELIAKACENFTGAEIEQAIVSAVYRAKAIKERFSAQHILQAVAQTAPIAVTRSEDIAALRHWAKGRSMVAH